MAVKIRLKRMGKIRAPYYRIVVADSRSKRDGRSIEEIGKYHPTEEPSFIEVDSERAQYWLSVGAQPSPQVEAILKLTGDWGIFKGEKGAKSTVRTKEAKVEFVADEKKKPVLKPKSEKPAAKVEDAPADSVKDVVSDGAVEEAPAAAEAAEAPEAAPAGDTAPADAAPADAAAADAPAAVDGADVADADAAANADAADVVEAEADADAAEADAAATSADADKA
ncbi:MAG: 30S ribosomal protein S16 [Salinibacterium sp.]|nr:30S ribosomal protein S16 [Salinibacterium sp.]